MVEEEAPLEAGGYLLNAGEAGGLLEDPRIRERLFGPSCLRQGKVVLQFEAGDPDDGSPVGDHHLQEGTKRAFIFYFYVSAVSASVHFALNDFL